MSKKELSGILIINESGVITSVDSDVEAIFGYGCGELNGKQAKIILPDVENISEPMGLFLKIASDRTLPRNHRGIKTDNSKITIEVMVSKLLFDNVLSYVCYISDISHIRINEKIDNLVSSLLGDVFDGVGLAEFSKHICDNLVKFFDFSLVSAFSKNANGSVRFEANSGILADKTPLPNINWRDTHDKSLIAKVIRSQKTLLETSGSLKTMIVPFMSYGEVVFVLEIKANDNQINQEIIAVIENFATKAIVALQVMEDQNKLKMQGAAIASTANAVFITDNKGKIKWVNNAFTKLSGYQPHEAIGATPAILKSGVQTDAIYKELWEKIKIGKKWSGEIVERHKNGSLYTVEQTITPIRVGNEENMHYVAVHDDLTAHKNAEGRIHHLANYDQLTGLYNRNAFINILETSVKSARLNGSKIAVLFVDLTNFNRINDTLGHFAGDKLLKAVAERISLILSERVVVARSAGDEFAIALTDVERAEEVAHFARQIIENILEPIDLGKDIINIGACVGISMYPDDGQSADKLINFADMALHKAVRSSPNSYFFFSKDMNIETEARLNLEQDLRRAIDHKEFILYYQPIISICKNAVVGFEALIRWKHPQKGMISPVNFIPIAEDTGLIVPIGDWVIKEAISQQKKWLEMGLDDTFVSINLSAVQFQQDGFADNIEKDINASQISPSCFELELTETVFMQDLKKTDEILSRLSKLGVRIAIDDFGTGYSSLNYLKKLSVDKLKVDRSFVHDMISDYDDEKIACAIINLGKSLGLDVVSEGVENVEQLEMLKQNGCDLIQGFLLAKPMPAENIPQFVNGFSIK